MRIIVISFLFLISFSMLRTESQVYNLRFEGFLDNREYFNPYISPQTIFGNRLSLELGHQYDSNNSFYGGISYLYEYGAELGASALDITLYYKNEKEPFLFYFGTFPRRNLINHPRVLLNDTLMYYRPNVQGSFVEVHGDWGHQNIWIDWLSRQTQTDEEVFLVGYSGLLKTNALFLETYMTMHHIAGTADTSKVHHLRDNGGFLAKAGVDLSSNLFLDKFSLAAGPVISYDRLRGVYPLEYHYGIIGSFIIDYKGYGIDYTFYKGDGQVQVFGDSFYTAKQYMRIEPYLTPFQNNNILVRLSFGFHATPGYFDNSQKLIVLVNLEDNPMRNK